MDTTNDLKMNHGIVSHKYFLINEQKAHKVLSWMGEVGEPSAFDYYSCTNSHIHTVSEMNSTVAEYASKGIHAAELSINPDILCEQLLESLYAAYAPALGDIEISYTYDRQLNVFSYDISEN